MLESAKKELSKKTREKYLFEIAQWEDSLKFISEEMKFLEKLLSAEIYEPNIPNLYEKLQQYSKNLQDLKNEEILLARGIEKHKTDFGQELEGNQEHKDSFLKSTHLQLRKNFKAFSKKNSGLKLILFKYTGTILKKSS